MDKRQEEAIEKWKELVYNKADEIDPDQECDWWDLALGFFLAREFSIEEATYIVEYLINNQLL